MRKLLGLTLAAALVLATLLALSAGQALANHVQCGDVITQDTTLDSDLIDCPGTALTIGADDITLDLAGYTVGACCSAVTTGVDDAGHHGVVIENGKVVGQTAIRLSDAHGTVLRDLDVSGIPGITLDHSTDNRLERSTVRSGNVALSLNDSDSNEIRQVVMMGYYYGVDLEAGSDHNLVADSTVSAEHFGATAIRVDHGGFNSFRQNQLRASFFGVVLIDAEGNEVRENTSRVNDADVFLLRSHDNLITRNEFVFSRDCKICLDESDRNVLGDNDLASVFASDMAIRVSGSENRIERNDASDNNAGIGVLSGTGNQLTRNAADRSLGFDQFFSDGDGIFVTDRAASTYLVRNETDRNAADGIDVRDPTSKLNRNSATDNGDLGIEAVPGAFGVGNRAFGNGNSLQCLNIACKTKGGPK